VAGEEGRAARGRAGALPGALAAEQVREGVSIEQVLEQRLRRAAYAPQATAAQVLAAVEDAARRPSRCG
jgi:hypothetical protein